jgi:hypothetical protein
MKYWNTSEKTWQNTPYMVKEYSVLSSDGQYMATVVVIPMGTKKVLVRGKNKGQEKESTSFVPMGVRIEQIRGIQGRKTEEERFTLPGKTFFLKKKTNTFSETDPWKFQYHYTRLQFDGYYPLLQKPTKNRTDESSMPFEESAYYNKFRSLVAQAWEAYEQHRAELRAAA